MIIFNSAAVGIQCFQNIVSPGNLVQSFVIGINQTLIFVIVYETLFVDHVVLFREVGGWGRDPKKCTGRDRGMGSSTI